MSRLHLQGKTRIITISVAGALLAGLLIGFSFPKTPPPQNARPEHATARINKGVLQGETKVPSQLIHANPRSISAAKEGTLTEIPTPGSTINIGQPLYRIDNNPVFLFRGATPTWRGFELGMSAGPDIQQLETTLQELGFLTREPTNKFTASTASAIRAWQRTTGQEITGTIPQGSILFATDSIRVGESTTTLGNIVSSGTEIYKATSLEKIITGLLLLADQNFGQVGTAVNIMLPDGRIIPGKIASVGVPIQANPESKRMVIPFTATLDNPTDADGIQEASVSTIIPTEQHENVLYVPVEALVTIDHQTFGIERVNTKGELERVPVTTGLFAKGFVEIAGEGIEEGQEVVVPS